MTDALIALLPIAVVLLMGLHIAMIRIHGISELSFDDPDDRGGMQVLSVRVEDRELCFEGVEGSDLRLGLPRGPDRGPAAGSAPTSPAAVAGSGAVWISASSLRMKRDTRSR